MIPENVRAVGREHQQIAEDIVTALNMVDREVRGLAAGGWTGDAATAFSAGWAECHRGGREIMQALVGMADKLGANADAVLAQDDANASEYQIPGISSTTQV